MKLGIDVIYSGFNVGFSNYDKNRLVVARSGLNVNCKSYVII